jgi:hypothetical protein
MTHDDKDLDIKKLKSLIDRVVKEIHKAPNRVRYQMNSFVIATGSAVKELNAYAKQAAKKIGSVMVDMGGTSCKVPDATEYILKVEKKGYLGKKKKTAKC